MRQALVLAPNRPPQEGQPQEVVTVLRRDPNSPLTIQRTQKRLPNWQAS